MGGCKRGKAQALLCVIAAVACGKSGTEQLNLGDPDPAKISLSYICENNFRVLNFNSIQVPATWSVENSGDHGDLTLPAAPGNQQSSETVFETHAIGTVVLSSSGKRLVSTANMQQKCDSKNVGSVQVAVSPGSFSMFTSSRQQFTAQVTGTTDFAVVWTVQEGSAGGSVDSNGLYTSPGTTGTFHVVATSHANPTRSGVATVTVRPAAINVTINPNAVSVAANGTQQFSAQVSGSPDTAVLWSVLEGAAGGSVDGTGLYTAPPGFGIFHVVATSHADSSRSAAATVTVGTEAGLSGPGRWDPPQTWPLVPIHVSLMRDGTVLTWSRNSQPYVWNPATNNFTQFPLGTNLFCAGTTFMADGRLMVTGGHITDDHGVADVNIFDPGTMSWTKQPSMAAGRWYPTAVTLADGGIVVIAGAMEDSNMNLIPEVRNADGTWRELTGASFLVPYYPRTFLAPNGMPYNAGSDRHTKFLDITGSGQWLQGPTMQYKGNDRGYGTAVMYRPGKILIAGGDNSPPTNTAEVLDLNDPSPAYRFTQSMNHARRHVNGTVLPDGKVLITGGTSGPGFNDESHAELSAELWDPATETWTELASETLPRVYHSVALLMPDARVLVGGGGEGGNGTDERNIEMYSPPYLFNSDGSLAARPQITSAPDAVGYGATFQFSSPDAANVTSVVLIKSGSVTHAFNFNQRFIPLGFTAGGGALTATAPSDPRVAPPGHYLLFILNAQGVPSVARIVHIG
jgi:Domain of unknown function (DUF1929)/Glyoxal oxidase N-terminus